MLQNIFTIHLKIIDYVYLVLISWTCCIQTLRRWLLFTLVLLAPQGSVTLHQFISYASQFNKLRIEKEFDADLVRQLQLGKKCFHEIGQR